MLFATQQLEVLRDAGASSVMAELGLNLKSKFTVATIFRAQLLSRRNTTILAVLRF